MILFFLNYWKSEVWIKRDLKVVRFLISITSAVNISKLWFFYDVILIHVNSNACVSVCVMVLSTTKLIKFQLHKITTTILFVYFSRQEQDNLDN